MKSIASQDSAPLTATPIPDPTYAVLPGDEPATRFLILEARRELTEASQHALIGHQPDTNLAMTKAWAYGIAAVALRERARPPLHLRVMHSY